MKERIYTIPVTDAFREECECPLCVLEKKLEAESIDYMLGPQLMEPDGRAVTNDKGFCRRHFEQLYNRQENRLGLGLMIDTYLCEQNGKIKKIYENSRNSLKKDAGISFVKNLSNKVSSKPTDTDKYLDELISGLNEQQHKCAVCSKLDFTMDRYIDVVLYLWFAEPDFKAVFNSKKGFCMKHFQSLLEGAKKYLNTKEKALFVENLVPMQMEHMERVQQEVNWFIKKFDYRYNDAPWHNSKDAIPRSIQKIVGQSDLK